MTVVKCSCGLDMREHNGVLVCNHCDAPACSAGPLCDAGHVRHPHACQRCVAYTVAVNARVNDEHAAERRSGS